MSCPWHCTALCDQGKGQELLFATTPTPSIVYPTKEKQNIATKVILSYLLVMPIDIFTK